MIYHSTFELADEEVHLHKYRNMLRFKKQLANIRLAEIKQEIGALSGERAFRGKVKVLRAKEREVNLELSEISKAERRSNV